MTNLARAIATERPTKMNKTEQAFAARLDILKNAGELKWWSWDRQAFRLSAGDKNFYKPDFSVVNTDDTMTMYDVKGSWTMHGQDRQLVKMKVAASEFPMYRWVAVKRLPKKQGGGWEERVF